MQERKFEQEKGEVGTAVRTNRPRRRSFLLRGIPVVLGICLGLVPANARLIAPVREPAVAGRFYSADPVKLRKGIEFLLERAAPRAGTRPIAIVSPHAGYIFSGQIAADAFAQARGFDYDLAVVIGVNHTAAGFEKISIYPSGGYRTPLGVVPIDSDLASRLIDLDADFTFQRGVHEREHSVEVQLPFVQVSMPEVPILAVVVGAPDPELCSKFGKVLGQLLKGRNALIVASSDLSHYPPYEDARRLDAETLESLKLIDFRGVSRVLLRTIEPAIPNLGTYACGSGPILAALAAAGEVGARGVRIVSYANSGDTAVGNRDQVVGYGSAVVTTSEHAPFPELGTVEGSGEVGGELAEEEKRSLLALARETIRFFAESEVAPLARGLGSFAGHRRGVFVTLKKSGELRGCIGEISPRLPLGQAVGRCALQAAFNDRRFSPVRPAELPEIDIEVSILSLPGRVERYTGIQLGRDGIILEKDRRSAVFLPSVPIEQGWNLEETLGHLCVKAGLPPDSWKAGAKLYSFQTVAFRESEFH